MEVWRRAALQVEQLTAFPQLQLLTAPPTWRETRQHGTQVLLLIFNFNLIFLIKIHFLPLTYFSHLTLFSSSPFLIPIHLSLLFMVWDQIWGPKPPPTTFHKILPRPIFHSFILVTHSQELPLHLNLLSFTVFLELVESGFTMWRAKIPAPHTTKALLHKNL